MSMCSVGDPVSFQSNAGEVPLGALESSTLCVRSSQLASNTSTISSMQHAQCWGCRIRISPYMMGVHSSSPVSVYCQTRTCKNKSSNHGRKPCLKRCDIRVPWPRSRMLQKRKMSSHASAATLHAFWRVLQGKESQLKCPHEHLQTLSAEPDSGPRPANWTIEIREGPSAHPTFTH